MAALRGAVADTLLGMGGFGKRLREAYEGSGYKSMRELSIACDLSPGHVQQWVEETSNPKLENVAKVAAKLGVPLDWLAFGTPPKYRRDVQSGSLDELADAVAERLHAHGVGGPPVTRTRPTQHRTKK